MTKLYKVEFNEYGDHTVYDEVNKVFLLVPPAGVIIKETEFEYYRQFGNGFKTLTYVGEMEDPAPVSNQTLIISIYDGGFAYNATAIDNKCNITEVEIDKAAIEQLTYNHNKDGIADLIEKYAHVIVCDNGSIEKIK